MFSRGIIYAPDYLVNAGGVINVARETGEVPTDFHVANMLDIIYDRTLECLDISAKKGIAPFIVADQMALDILGE